MESDEVTGEAEARQAAHQQGRLFAVRLWKEALDGGSEYRGSVRDLVTNGSHRFRDWPDLIAFMVARVEKAEAARDARAEAGR